MARHVLEPAREVKVTISYSSVIENRAKIGAKFPKLVRKGRAWSEIPCVGTVLNFGSGKVTGANHSEIKRTYRLVFSCDSDPNSGADWASLEEATSGGRKFDMIVAEHVLEHIDTPTFVDVVSVRLAESINPDGKLVITIPNIYCFGTFFSDYDHKNFAAPLDIAAIICCRGFEMTDFFRWSKSKHMSYQVNMTEAERFVEEFVEKNYGLQSDRYLTMVFKKNG